MSDLKMSDLQPRLVELVEQYAQLDEKEKQFRELKKPLNHEIKKLMEQLDIKKLKTEHYNVQYGVRTSSTVNETKLLEILQQRGLTQYIKTVQQPDVEALTEAIRENKVDPHILQDSVEVKESVYLTVRRIKNGESKNS